MSKYDLTVLVKATVSGAGLDKLVEKLEKTAKALGGSVTKHTDMGRKQLAYRINNESEANYMDFTVELPADGVIQLEKKLAVDKEVIRHLITKIEE